MANAETPAEKKEEAQFDVGSILPAEETLNDILTRYCRPGWKPNVDALADAIVDGKLIVPVGGKLLIVYPFDWRDTVIWTLMNFDETTGNVRLWDPNRCFFGASNIIVGPQRGLVFKVPDAKRRWVPGEEQDTKTRRRRRRTKDKETPAPKPVQVDADGNPIKKKRGRPKGSKNKSTLEREAKKKEVA